MKLSILVLVNGKWQMAAIYEEKKNERQRAKCMFQYSFVVVSRILLVSTKI